MDRSTLLAFLLIGLIFLLWMSPWYQKNIIGVHRQNSSDTTQVTAVDTLDRSPSHVPASDMALIQETPALKPARQTGSTDRDTTVSLHNNRIQALLSSRGGGTLLGWKLIEKSPDKPAEYRYKVSVEENEPVQLIPEDAIGNLAISTDRGLDFSQLPFELTEDTQDENGETARLVFTYTLNNGAKIVRQLSLEPDSYHLKMDIQFIDFDWEQVGEKFRVEWQSGLNPTEPNIRKNDALYYEGLTLQGDELERQKKGSTGFRDGVTHWVSIRTKYFLMALIPDEPGVGAEITVEDGSWKVIQTDLALSWKGMQNETHSVKVFLGPMDYQLLKSYGIELERAMSWGWTIFKPLSIGALYVLQWMTRTIHNYGWAIIIFGILIKVILYPLTRHSYQSMKEMQALQPKMTALRDKYKSDPQKLNEETMKLYKTHGVNPMGGCLPLLLQMPVLFALFNLFRSTIMLRHAEFYLIKDLSAPDHILGSVNVLPLLMGISMIIQQRLSSASSQNPQQKTMAFMMPIVFLFLFYNFSSGLNLYYLVFNVFTIAQELLIKRPKNQAPATA
jgi:YidC/Oxa1 family membrane protein insertase